MITNAQYKTSMLYFNKQRADASTKQANLKEKQYNQKQQDEAEKKKIKQEANHAAAEYDKAKARGDKKAMAYWRARYTELTGQEPPGEKSSSSKSVIGTPSLNFDTTLLTQEK
jgi:hypothetical protein